jgi:hypothetical protein
MIRAMKMEVRQNFEGKFYYQLLSDTVGVFSTYEDAERDGNAALNTVVEKFTSYNNGSTPCRFFSRDKVFTGQSADGGNMYQSVPWCNHEPSQRAVP